MTDLTPETPAADAARRVVSARLAAVAARLAPSAGPSHPPPRSPGLTAGPLGSEQLRVLFAAFNDRIADRPKSAAALHQARIAGKRLRYAIEVFAGCFPAALREAYYPAVAAAQDLL